MKSHKKYYVLSISLMALLVACGDDSTVATGTDLGGTDMGHNAPDLPISNEPDQGSPDLPDPPDMPVDEPDMAEPDAEPDLPPTTTCRTQAPADGPRKLVVSKPYGPNSMPANTLDVYDVAVDGQLSSVTATFALGQPIRDGKIVFTPDGEVGIARLENGKLGSFRFEGNNVVVIQPEHDPGEYISQVIFPPGDGSFVYATKVGWREHNAGLFRIPVDCQTGELGEAKLVAPAKLLYGVVFDGDKRAFMAAIDVLDSEEPNHVHEVVLDEVPERLQSGQAFLDDEAILGGFDITPDAEIALVGDISMFGTYRVGVVDLTEPMKPIQTLEIEDPEDIVISPYGNAALVASVFGDALVVLDVDTTNQTTPVEIRGNLSTADPVLLPAVLVMLRRGSLAGNVWVTENVGIRRVRFEANGEVTDLGFTSTGQGVPAIPGAIGITP